MGLRPDLAKDHWRGLEFYNSTVDQIYNQTERLYYNASLSFLEYVDISYAGLDLYYGDGIRHALATISASPYVPMMNNITISHGAFDALNLTEIRGNIHIANSSISHNRGKINQTRIFLYGVKKYVHVISIFHPYMYISRITDKMWFSG